MSSPHTARVINNIKILAIVAVEESDYFKKKKKKVEI